MNVGRSSRRQGLKEGFRGGAWDGGGAIRKAKGRPKSNRAASGLLLGIAGRGKSRPADKLKAGLSDQAMGEKHGEARLGEQAEMRKRPVEEGPAGGPCAESDQKGVSASPRRGLKDMELDTSSIEKRFAFGFLQQLLRWMDISQEFIAHLGRKNSLPSFLVICKDPPWALVHQLVSVEHRFWARPCWG